MHGSFVLMWQNTTHSADETFFLFPLKRALERSVQRQYNSHGALLAFRRQWTPIPNVVGY